MLKRKREHLPEFDPRLISADEYCVFIACEAKYVLPEVKFRRWAVALQVRVQAGVSLEEQQQRGGRPGQTLAAQAAAPLPGPRHNRPGALGSPVGRF